MKPNKSRTDMMMETLGADSDTLRREREKEIKELEARSKKLSELVVSERFTVEEAFGTSIATSIMPLFEQRIGGTPSVYNGGYCSRIILRVKPDNLVIPVRTLEFEGNSVVRAGDHISALIPKYEEKEVDLNIFPSRDSEGKRVFYLERSYREIESAIEIAILSQDGKISRTDRAVSYTDLVHRSLSG